MYSDYGPITDAAEMAQGALEQLGAKVTMVPFPIITTDFLTPLTEAANSGADARPGAAISTMVLMSRMVAAKVSRK